MTQSHQKEHGDFLPVIIENGLPFIISTIYQDIGHNSKIFDTSCVFLTPPLRITHLKFCNSLIWRKLQR